MYPLRALSPSPSRVPVPAPALAATCPSPQPHWPCARTFPSSRLHLLPSPRRAAAAPPLLHPPEYIQHMLSENYQFQWSRCCMIVNNGNLTTLGCEGKCILPLIPSSTYRAWHPTRNPPTRRHLVPHHICETAWSCARFAHSLRSLAHRRQNSSRVFRPLPALRTSLLVISPRRILSSEKERNARGLRPRR